MVKAKYEIGYTAGVFDMFHIGHLNLLRAAKESCNYLIVGVNTDDLVKDYKNKIPIIPLQERMAIVKSVCYVDQVVAAETLDKIVAWEKLKFNVLFIGDDWKGTSRYLKTEEQLKEIGVDIIYLPYTHSVSSSKLIDKLYELL